MKTTRFLATLALAAAPPLASASAADVYASAPADAPDTFSVGVKARGDLVGTGAYLGAVPLDADGTELAARSELSTQLRVGATVKAQYMVGHFPIALVLDGEGDFLSGPQTEGTDVEGVDLPGTEGSQNVLRSAHAVLAFGNV
ncbi:MAG: hypothetical protein KC620_22235, partial [Myxococcales bacterium]|nr:hypothetical protein [Myxococcales bacterium]